MRRLTTQIYALESLPKAIRENWQSWVSDNPDLYSPYFHPGFFDTVAKFCPDIHVLSLSQGDGCVALLPFQAKVKAGGRVGYARPVGAPMSDYHGLIYPNHFNANAADLDLQKALTQAGFGAFHFSAVPKPQTPIGRYARTITPCTVMRFPDGAAVWRAARDASYRRHLKSTRRRIKKSLEIGERRFEFQSRSQEAFATLIRLKREKFKTTGKYDVLSVPWTQNLLKRLWEDGANPKTSSGVWADMHVLYFGDKIAAIDLGLTDGTTFHSWMVAYNGDFHTLAPGIQLLEALIDESQALRYTCIDLGEGLDGYKRHYASTPVSVASGFIAARGPTAALSRLYGSWEKFGESHLGDFGKWPAKARRRYAQISACDKSLRGRTKAVLQAFKPPVSNP